MLCNGMTGIMQHQGNINTSVKHLAQIRVG